MLTLGDLSKDVHNLELKSGLFWELTEGSLYTVWDNESLRAAKVVKATKTRRKSTGGILV